MTDTGIYDRAIERYQKQLDELIRRFGRTGRGRPAVNEKKDRLRTAIAYLAVKKCEAEDVLG